MVILHAVLLVLLTTIMEIKDTQSIGVCYGGNGNSDIAIPEQEVIQLYKTKGIKSMRIYDPNPTVLQALKGSNIDLILGVANGNLEQLASDPSTATQWVQNNVRNFISDIKFRYIAVGNEVQPTDPFSQYVLPAMQNIYNAVASAGLGGQIQVSTVIDLRLLNNPYPPPTPSQMSFNSTATSYINPIIDFLLKNEAPLLADVYPYFRYSYNMATIELSYALIASSEGGMVVKDGELEYHNLFDELLDGLYSAIEKAGATNLEIVVTESGWPSAGGPAATVDNGGAYYRNLINHVNLGTPKKPGKAIETYLFEMFDENKKNGDESEKHFGLFDIAKQSKYQISFP